MSGATFLPVIELDRFLPSVKCTSGNTRRTDWTEIQSTCSYPLGRIEISAVFEMDLTPTYYHHSFKKVTDTEKNLSSPH